jgi:signal transduction histidine kinase/CheY-like chemotaxis protein
MTLNFTQEGRQIRRDRLLRLEANMKQASAGFDLRVSAGWSLVLILIAAVWLMLFRGGPLATLQYDRTQLFGASLICLLVASLFVLVIWPTLGRWLIVLGTSVFVILAHCYLNLPGTLPLLALSTGMAVALASVRAGAVTVVAQTITLLILRRVGVVSGGEISVALFATWSIFGILAGVYHPVYQLEDWSWSQYRESRAHVEEARDRRAQLEYSLQEYRRTNRQLALDNQRMAALRTVADDARRSKVAFVSRVSHEFRAPLNMIIGLTGLMIDRPESYSKELPSDLRTDLEIIYRNSNHLGEMVNDVLDLSQTEVGRLTLHCEHIDLVEVIAEATKVVSPLVDKKRLSLVLNLPPRPLTVYCDRTRIHQVLLNLLSNAARFTEAGAIAVEVEGTSNEVIVEVSDTGPGIAPEAVQRLFEPFYRVSSTSQKVAGSGLGLSISREIVQHHGGRIWVESEPGKGTSFFFSLPTSKPSAPTAPPGHQIIQDWVWYEDGFRTERVAREASFFRPLFVVLDPENTLDVLKNQEQDIEFIITCSVDETLDVLGQYSAHAVLVNIHMFGSESGALLDRLRSASPGTLVVACDLSNPLARAWKAGADTYLIKPVLQESLVAALERLPHRVRSLLIVDDEPEGAALLTRIVQSLDPSIAVNAVASAEAALATMRVQRPDLVLLDVVMPHGDGWSILESMSVDPCLEDVSVFFVSGADPSEVPPISENLTVTLDGGIPVSRLLEVSFELSRILLAREK